MKNMGASMLHWLWLSGLIVVLDQVTKLFANKELYPYEEIILLPFFSLTLAFNSGAAFSFLSGGSGWQRWFLSVIAVVVSIMLVSWLHRLKPHEGFQACSLAFILGGAIGNLYDRVLNGYVIDFILVHYDRFYFPAFNVADCGISIGAAMLILDMFTQNKA